MATKSGSNKGWAVVVILVGLVWGVNSFIDWVKSIGGTSADQQAANDDSDAAEQLAADPSSAANAWPPLDGNSPPPASDLTASNYYIVLDGSGSMAQTKCAGGSTKMKVALAALDRFVGTVPAEANLGMAVFDRRDLSERVPLATNNRQAFASALRQVRPSGSTPLRSSIGLGYEQLTQQAKRQLGYGEYHLVVVTDGNPDPDSEDPADVVQSILTASPVVVHTIGFCIGTDHVLNQPGRTLYMAADSPEQLDQGLAAVLAEAPSFDAASFEN